MGSQQSTQNFTFPDTDPPTPTTEMSHSRHPSRPRLFAPHSASRGQPRPQGPSRPPPPQRRYFSEHSSPEIPNSLFFSSDFLLGAGMAIIQPSTGKVLVLFESQRGYWFLPKGRKDVGESIEQAALREAYEESGYRAEFLPLITPTNAPTPPGSHYHRGDILNTEPIYISIASWGPRRINPAPGSDNGGEYFTFWYVGQIPENAIHEENTGMPDEKNYTSHILDLDDAVEKLHSTGGTTEALILAMAYRLWRATVDFSEREASRSSRLSNAPRPHSR